jgi:hypothetical protein
MEVAELFEKHKDEFLKFDRIPESERRHERPDLCAMLYLHERFGGTGDAVDGAEHDEIALAWRPEELTEADVIYVTRCGVRYNSKWRSLAMFV